MDREPIKEVKKQPAGSKKQQGDVRQPVIQLDPYQEKPMPTTQRNFVKENVRRIKLMKKAELNGLRTTSDIHPKQNDSNIATSPSLVKIKPQRRRLNIQNLDIRPADRRIPGNISDLVVINNISHRSMQTEATDILEQIYANGVIKYPKGALQPQQHRNLSPRKRLIRKDGGNGDSLDVNNATKEEIRADFIRKNVMALKAYNNNKKTASATVTNISVKTHRRSRLSKVAKANKKQPEVQQQVVDEDCPPGHVLLPDEERKETLRVLRESYAEKIQEMNLLPVRSENLKMQKRKMDLELELKKIDEGIKVFQRPKVYVKVDG